MGKGKFIVGTIFSVISALCFAFGALLLYYATHITKPEETVAAIVAIPFAFIFYGSQIISAVLLWINFAKGGAAKKNKRNRCDNRYDFGGSGGGFRCRCGNFE